MKASSHYLNESRSYHEKEELSDEEEAEAFLNGGNSSFSREYFRRRSRIYEV